MNVLAIETSCDETSFALIKGEGGLKNPKFKVLKNIVLSQIKVHSPFGGIVPNLAKREHLTNLPILYQKVEKFIKNRKINIDLIAVTIGPGLEPALWTGINFAKNIHKEKFPHSQLVGVNHIEGHLYSFLLGKDFYQFNPSKIYPAIALIVSGGHTILLYLKDIITWKKLGETKDDAVGEAFDKVGRMLNLPYPGGPEIEKVAKKGNSDFVNFPRPMIYQKNYDFSFSGLKTSVLYFLQDLKKEGKKLDENLIANIAASFQKAAFDVLVYKTLKAAQNLNAKSVILAGGVAANKFLRKELKKECVKNKIIFFAPPFDFNTDNAAMIGVAAYIQYLKGKKRRISAQANLEI